MTQIPLHVGKLYEEVFKTMTWCVLFCSTYLVYELVAMQSTHWEFGYLAGLVVSIFVTSALGIDLIRRFLASLFSPEHKIVVLARVPDVYEPSVLLRSALSRMIRAGAVVRLPGYLSARPRHFGLEDVPPKISSTFR